MAVRLELVEPCEHGYVELPNDQSRHAQSTVPGGCPGGSRRVLSVRTDQMIEAVAEGWFEAEGVMPNNEFDIDPLTWADVDEIVKRDYRHRARAALTAAFNTLGIQEKADTT